MSELVVRVRPGRECRVCGESARVMMKTDRRMLDGHGTICRSCHRVQLRVRKAALRARSAEQVKQVRQARYPDGLKRCPTCQQDRALSEFSPDPGQLDGLDGQCAECGRIGHRRSAAKNKTRSEGELKAIWASRYPDGLRPCRGGHVVRLEAFNRQATKPDGLHAYCRACHAEREAARYRREAEQQWADQGVDPNWCYLGGHTIPDGDRHADHVVPVALAGDHSDVLPACRRCNISKNARPLTEVLGNQQVIEYSEELVYATDLDRQRRLGLDIRPITPAEDRWLNENCIGRFLAAEATAAL